MQQPVGMDASFTASSTNESTSLYIAGHTCHDPGVRCLPSNVHYYPLMSVTAQSLSTNQTPDIERLPTMQK